MVPHANNYLCSLHQTLWSEYAYHDALCLPGVAVKYSLYRDTGT